MRVSAPVPAGVTALIHHRLGVIVVWPVVVRKPSRRRWGGVKTAFRLSPRAPDWSVLTAARTPSGLPLRGSDVGRRTGATVVDLIFTVLIIGLFALLALILRGVERL
jgi:hypothetical protein